ncbi:o-spanin [Stenotrophomonas phage Paxi]|uniref:O-spanin n=1 Tax=Stenotrophomonas phage Paxi TaxID=2859653 RepID=A0AAE7WM97_9CAUD|nr:o-spanin [Stenotrophomonas phage Paxi]QYW01844.1 o-spanin [Stenotrophomonas phage Paxi]
MHWLKRIGNMMSKLLPCALITLAGCNSVPNGRPYTNVKPKLEPLSVEVSQAMQANSTPLLKKADLWYENSGLLLDSVTNKSEP